MEPEENKKEITSRPIVVENYLKFAIYLLVVVAVGLLALNQTLSYFYKTHFLKSPCDLCGELNPGVEECIKDLNAPRASYWNEGGWTDPFNINSMNLTFNNSTIPLLP